MALDLPKLLSKSSFKGPGASKKQNTVYRDNHLQNIWDKIYFSCEITHYGKNSISIFQEFFASINFFLRGRSKAEY